MRVRTFALALSLVTATSLFTAPATRATDLKIATWNLNWLTSHEGGLPADVKIRAPGDFDLLRAYAQELNADVVAMEEVDNAETARRLFPPDAYSIHMSHDRVRQRVGFAVRRGLRYEVNQDVTAIALDPADHLRSGVDITLLTASGPLRMLAVHLKQGCQYFVIGRTPHAPCVTLTAQFDLIAQWIAARQGESTAFVVLGDFNRELDRNDLLSRTIATAAPMTRATEGFTSPCWGHESFIDHILIGGSAREWIQPNSLRVLGYRETDPAWKERLSDHCPVSVHLGLPD